MPSPRFTDDTVKFLRDLKAHNDREWFKARRDQYETQVKTPMVEVIQHLATRFTRIAPELVATPKVSMYRIYRDTRFSADKSPYKTHVAAVFPHKALTKHGGAGLYFHVDAAHVLVGAGIYAPDPRQLYTLRTHLAKNLKRFRTVVESPVFRRSFGRVNGQRLKRVPKGFDADDPAAEYLKLKQFLAGTERPSSFATSPRFCSSLIRLFEQLVPFVRFLNESLAENKPRRNLGSPLSV